MDSLRVNSPFSYIYSVLAPDPDGQSADVIGLTFLDPVDPLASEVRTTISPNISRVIMRTTKASISCPFVRGTSATVFAWEVLDLESAIRRGFVKLFHEHPNGPSREYMQEIIQAKVDFWHAVKPYYRKNRPMIGMIPGVNAKIVDGGDEDEES